jgi:hypothetical protein
MLLSEVVEPLMITSGLVPRRAATNDVKGLADLSEGWYREVKSRARRVQKVRAITCSVEFGQ